MILKNIYRHLHLKDVWLRASLKRTSSNIDIQRKSTWAQCARPFLKSTLPPREIDYPWFFSHRREWVGNNCCHECIFTNSLFKFISIFSFLLSLQLLWRFCRIGVIRMGLMKCVFQCVRFQQVKSHLSYFLIECLLEEYSLVPTLAFSLFFESLIISLSEVPRLLLSLLIIIVVRLYYHCY